MCYTRHVHARVPTLQPDALSTRNASSHLPTAQIHMHDIALLVCVCRCMSTECLLTCACQSNLNIPCKPFVLNDRDSDAIELVIAYS